MMRGGRRLRFEGVAACEMVLHDTRRLDDAKNQPPSSRVATLAVGVVRDRDRLILDSR